MRKALIEISTGKVVNVLIVESDGVFVAPQGFTLQDAGTGGPGDTWNGTVFAAAPLPAADAKALARSTLASLAAVSTLTASQIQAALKALFTLNK